MTDLGKNILYAVLILLSIAVIVCGVALIVHLLGANGKPDDTSDSIGTSTSAPPPDESDSTALNDTDTHGSTDGTDTETDGETDDTAASGTDDGVLVIEYDEPVIMYATSNVNARMKDTTESDIMGMLYKGDSITVTGETANKWYRVNYRGYVAYIRADLLTSDSSVATVKIESYDAPVTMYAISNVNVRASHSTNSEKYEMIAVGTEVSVVGHTENGWYQISYGDGFAYISDDYLSEEMPADTDSTPNE